MMNILHAIRWAAQSWYEGVKSTTIMKCFWKSTLIARPAIQTPHDALIDPSRESEEPLPDMELLYNHPILVARIQDRMSLQNFLNPVDEDELCVD